MLRNSARNYTIGTSLKSRKTAISSGFSVPRGTRLCGRVMFHVEHSARLEAHRHDQIKGIVVIRIMEHASCIRVLKFSLYLFTS